VTRVHESLRAARERVAALRDDDGRKLARAEFARFALGEIDAAAVEDDGEDERLRARRDVLTNAERVLASLATASAALEEDGAAVDAMGTPTLDIRVQTRAVIENIRDLLRDAGAELADLVQISAYLVSMNDFGGYNETYAEYFDESGPTRTTVAVHQLPHPHLLIEIQAIAHVPNRMEVPS